MKVADIKVAHDSKRDLIDPWFRFVIRPISFPLAWLLIKLGIKPNQVTISGITLGTIGCFLMPFYPIFGVLLVWSYTLSDSLDGIIARATNSITKIGALIDGVGYLIIVGLIFPTVGLRLYLHPETLLRFPPVIFLLLGFVGAYARLYRYSITNEASLVLMREKPVYYQDGPSMVSKLFKMGIYAIELRDPLLLLCVLTDTLSLFVVFYALVNTAEFFTVMYKTIRWERNER